MLKTITEIGHIYADTKNLDNLKEAIDTYKNINIKTLNNKNFFLIDDLNVNHIHLNNINEYQNYINDFFNQNNININKFYYEKEIIKKVNIDIFKNMISKEKFRKQKKEVFFLNIKKEKIPLFEIDKYRNTKYYCQILSFFWLKYKIEKYSPEKIITIIDKNFQKIEENNIKIIRELNLFPDIEIENIFY